MSAIAESEVLALDEVVEMAIAYADRAWAQAKVHPLSRALSAKRGKADDST